jgi:hypothetical protein
MNKLLLLILLLVPALACAGTASGVEGSIRIGPVQGGPIRPGSRATQPLAAAEFVVRQNGKVITTFRTDAEGKFRLSLSPGHYSVMRKEAGKIGFFGPFEFDVVPGKMKTVDWECDSGIR